MCSCSVAMASSAAASCSVWPCTRSCRSPLPAATPRRARHLRKRCAMSRGAGRCLRARRQRFRPAAAAGSDRARCGRALRRSFPGAGLRVASAASMRARITSIWRTGANSSWASRHSTNARVTQGSPWCPAPARSRACRAPWSTNSPLACTRWRRSTSASAPATAPSAGCRRCRRSWATVESRSARPAPGSSAGAVPGAGVSGAGR